MLESFSLVFYLDLCVVACFKLPLTHKNLKLNINWKLNYISIVFRQIEARNVAQKHHKKCKQLCWAALSTKSASNNKGAGSKLRACCHFGWVGPVFGCGRVCSGSTIVKSQQWAQNNSSNWLRPLLPMRPRCPATGGKINRKRRLKRNEERNVGKVESPNELGWVSAYDLPSLLPGLIKK